MSKGIRCSDELPKAPCDVQVYCSDTKEQFVAFLDRKYGLFTFAMDHEGNSIRCNPTHWQPLPEPPTDD